MLIKVKDDLLSQIQEKKRLKENQNKNDSMTIPQYSNPHNYTCHHGYGDMPCALCNKKYPMKMLTKRALSQNRMVERKKQIKL